MVTEFHIGCWYSDGKRTYQVLAITDDRLIVQYHGEPEPTRCLIAVQAKLVEPVDGPSLSALPPDPRPKGKKSAIDRDQTFTLAETAPVVADLIHRHAGASGDYLTHDVIVHLILNDPKGAALVKRAIHLGNSSSSAKIAGNMLDHFSARITDCTSPYTDQFDRRKIDGKWAYQPRRSDGGNTRQDESSPRIRKNNMNL
jgi:hypothetical protein